MQYTGHEGDDGTNKAELYQGPVRGISPGQTVQFSLCVTGTGTDALTKAYAIVGVEAFTVDGTYIADVSTNVTKVTKTPTKYTASTPCRRARATSQCSCRPRSS